MDSGSGEDGLRIQITIQIITKNYGVYGTGSDDGR
jgi:hypothetical protein